MDITWNITDYEPAGEYDILPEGEYLAEIIDIEAKERGEQIAFEIVHGAHKGRRAWEHLNFVARDNGDFARGRVRMIAEAAGNVNIRNTEQLIGARVVILIGHREYNGKTYANIKSYRAPKNEGHQAAPPPAAAPQQRHQAQTQQAAPISDDDIPF